MTVLEILNRTKVFFEKKGVPDPLLDAQYIISHGLGMKNRMDLYLSFEKPLTPAELDTLRPLVARRAAREPLQHIIGNTSFRGFCIKCDPRALIPRLETEELVDMAKDSLKTIEQPFIVEIGTGTGAISIASAKEIAGAKILATDISTEALALARENAKENGLESELQVAQGDLLDAVTADIIAQVTGDKPEVDKFDPALALYGGPDGLNLVRKLLQQTEGKLSSGASIFLEIGSEQAEMLKNEAGNYPWLDFAGIHKDYCGNIRFVSYKAK